MYTWKADALFPVDRQLIIQSERTKHTGHMALTSYPNSVPISISERFGPTFQVM